MLQMRDTAGTLAVRAGRRRTKAPTTFTLLEPISEVNRLLVSVACMHHSASLARDMHAHRLEAQAWHRLACNSSSGTVCTQRACRNKVKPNV